MSRKLKDNAKDFKSLQTTMNNHHKQISDQDKENSIKIIKISYLLDLNHRQPILKFYLVVNDPFSIITEIKKREKSQRKEKKFLPEIGRAHV